MRPNSPRASLGDTFSVFGSMPALLIFSFFFKPKFAPIEAAPGFGLWFVEPPADGVIRGPNFPLRLRRLCSWSMKFSSFLEPMWASGDFPLPGRLFS